MAENKDRIVFNNRIFEESSILSILNDSSVTHYLETSKPFSSIRVYRCGCRVLIGKDALPLELENCDREDHIIQEGESLRMFVVRIAIQLSFEGYN